MNWRKLTDKPFWCQYYVDDEKHQGYCDCYHRRKVPVVTTGAGTPKHIMPYLKEAGIKVIPVIASVKACKKWKNWELML